MKEPRIFTFDFKDLQVSKKSVQYLLNTGEDSNAHDMFSASIDNIMSGASSLFSIRGAYIIHQDITIDSEQKRVSSHGELFNTGQIVTHQLRRAEQLAWFICTAGQGVSDESAKLMNRGDLIEGYILDVLANVVVEAAMDRIQAALKEEMASLGFLISNRYSPGYCEWNVSEQFKLFKAFPENYLDIGLTESSLMLPVKSVSGVIGIGKKVKYNEYTCNLCSDTRCIYRNKKFTE